MVFVDDLTSVLNLLVLVCATVFYTGVFVLWHARKQDYERAEHHLREGGFLMGLFGGILLIFSVWGQFSWPLPAQFNLYFYDPLLLMSLLLLAFAAAVMFRLPTHFVGMLGVVMGSGVIYYGVRADYVYGLSLTTHPFETLLLYVGFGAMAIMSFPATLYLDWFVTGPKTPATGPVVSGPRPEMPRMWYGILIVFLVIVALAGIAAIAYGFTTAWAHLEHAP